MQPVKTAKESGFMWSETSSSNMRSNEPEMLQPSNKQHVHGECPVKSLCSDMQCQETSKGHKKPVQPDKKESYYMQSKEPAI